jgi:hypothetical protein
VKTVTEEQDPKQTEAAEGQDSEGVAGTGEDHLSEADYREGDPTEGEAADALPGGEAESVPCGPEVVYEETNFRVWRMGNEAKLRIKFSPAVKVEDWDALEPYYRSQIAEGIVQWEADLTELAMVNSRMIGLLIGLNTILALRGGGLKLLAARRGLVARTLIQSRVHQIMELQEV